MIKKITDNIVRIIGIFSLLFCIAAIGHGIFGLKHSHMAGRFGLAYSFDHEKAQLEIAFTTEGFPAEEAGLKEGDIVLSINDQKITRYNYNKLWGEGIAGTTLTLEIKRGSEIMEISLTRKLLPLFERLVFLLFLIVLPLVMTSYVIVGLWGIFKAPSFITNLIALVCFAFAYFLYEINISAFSSPISEFLYFHEIKNILFILGSSLAPIFWILLFLHFPEENKFFSKHRKLFLLIISLIPLAILLWLAFYPDILTQTVKYLILTIYMFIYISSGIWILDDGASKVSSVLKKRQYHLMKFGIKYGALFILAGMIPIVIRPFLFPGASDLIAIIINYFFIFTQVCGLILPFTFLNSFFQNRILETESALKRSLLYIGASTALFLVYMFIVFYISTWMIIGFEVTDPSIIILFILIVSITFTPLNNKILKWLEIRLYPERTRYRESLHHIIKKMPEFIDTESLLSFIANWMENTMGIHPVYTIKTQNTDMLIDDKNGIYRDLKSGKIIFWDELNDLNTKKPAFIDNKISLSIPMIHQKELMGVLNIGKKENNQDFNGDDLEIFRDISEHTAIALKNIKLQADYLEKKRMEKELEVARSIQVHLLPKSIPKLNGLELDSLYIPCNEVAGDYFDIIPLEDKKTALVIADVSGKGMGAALLMSNLQASLRMALSLSVSLNDIFFKINDLICKNSLKSQFITFFTGLWDIEKKELIYINAGHNPPLLFRENGSIQSLSPSGTAMGIKPHQHYKTSSVRFFNNDILFIYSDGIEEYFNEDLDLYGIDNIKRVINNNKDKDPKEITEYLMKDLRDFAGKAPQKDDITFIVSKIIC